MTPTQQKPTEEKKEKKKTKKERKVKDDVAEIKPAEDKNAPQTPVLALLAGSDFATCKPQVLMDRVVKSINERVASNPSMTLRGRTADFFRINYDPTAKDITSLRGRMGKLLPPKGDHLSLELLLCPLVSSNPRIFGIKPKKLAARVKLDEAPYHSFWIHHQREIEKVSPITCWPRRKEIIATIVEMARKRCEKVDPGSALPRKPADLPNVLAGHEQERVREWSLHGVDTGLGAKVRGCFNSTERPPREYEDLIERTLYCFKCANRSAIYGPKIDGTKPIM